jgi:hypothetical protein
MFSGQGVARESSSGHHEVVLEMVRKIAIGLEVAESVAMGVEVTEVRATIMQRRDLYGSTPRTTLDGLQEPELREAARAEPLREAPNCTTTADETGESNSREGVAFRLQIMGVFTLCGLLATLGWGGMTGLIVLISKVWSMEDAREYKDASTNMGSLGSQGRAQLLKPMVISPREESARWE